MRRLCLIVIACAACVGPQDDASQLRDLRVIGASMSPPEIMAPSCAGLLGAVADGGMPDLSSFFAFAAPVEMKWLVLDPRQREISYTLRACTNTFDLECDDDGGYAELASGAMLPGELKHTLPLGLTTLTGSLFDGGTSLIAAVVNNDTYKGLGGIRVPVVLHVTAGAEQTFAQKLMVYSCKLFDDQKANVQPDIPGVTYLGVDWPESTDGGPTLTINLGNVELEMEPTDFSALEEDYVVPSLMLKPVHLKESWQFSWHATLGRFSPVTSGGTDFSGMVTKPKSEWLPRIDGGTAGLLETDVDFYIVVRDGRGGSSWIQRRAHFIP